MTISGKVLIIEDDPSDRRELKDVLEREGFAVKVAASKAEGLQYARQEVFDAIVTDLNLYGSAALDSNEGLEVIRQLHAEKPQLPVILITGQPSSRTIIEAMRLGAHDYIPKRINFEKFIPMLEKAVARSRFLTQSAGASRPVRGGESEIIGNSPAMHGVLKQIGQMAPSSAAVLIRGETGTGKELVACALHQHSFRAEKPFVIVNCPTIPPSLLVAELFGSEPGAYTDAKARRIGQFEQAQGGTIFLDEIGDMPEDAQKQLLRVLQEKTIQRLGGGKETIPVDVRIIAATHRDLELAIVEKTFREDLYHRINVAVIHLPPLRERREDIPELVDHFLHQYAAELDIFQPSIDPGALKCLQEYAWPGNVRELQNVIRKANFSGRGIISEDIVQDLLRPQPSPIASSTAALADRIADLLVKAQRGEIHDVQAVLTSEIERELYGQAIRLANGDQTKAASWLGVSRPTMREKLVRHGLHPGKDHP